MRPARLRLDVPRKVEHWLEPRAVLLLVLWADWREQPDEPALARALLSAARRGLPAWSREARLGLLGPKLVPLKPQALESKPPGVLREPQVLRGPQLAGRGEPQAWPAQAQLLPQPVPQWTASSSRP